MAIAFVGPIDLGAVFGRFLKVATDGIPLIQGFHL